MTCGQALVDNGKKKLPFHRKKPPGQSGSQGGSHLRFWLREEWKDRSTERQGKTQTMEERRKKKLMKCSSCMQIHQV